MKTEIQPLIYALSTAGVFWVSLLDLHLFISVLVVYLYCIQFAGALMHTLPFLFHHREVPAALKKYYIINALYITVCLIVYWIGNAVFIRFCFSLSLIIISWNFINVFFYSKKEAHV